MSEILELELRSIISHRMLGYDCNMSKEDFDGMIEDCAKIKTKTMTLGTFTNKYNEICKINLSKNGSLTNLTDYELYIWIAGQTFKFGRSLKDSLVNAKFHLKNRAKAEKSFEVKKIDLLGGC